MEQTNPKLKTQEKSNRDITPPYLSVVQLSRVMELASNRNFTSVSRELFEQYGLNKSDSLLAFNTFRFLNLIDDSGKATEMMGKLHLQGDIRKKEFQEIISLAYKRLFDATNNKPYDLGSKDLINEFIINYKITLRIARAAVPAFLKLCEYGGLREETSHFTRNKPREKTVLRKQEAEKTSLPTLEDEQDHYFNISIVEGKMNISIPKEIYQDSWTDDDLNGDLRGLVKKANDFAKKHVIKEKKSLENLDFGINFGATKKE